MCVASLLACPVARTLGSSHCWDTMHDLNHSWESVMHEAVKNCFKMCGFRCVPAAKQLKSSVSDDALAWAPEDEIEVEFWCAGTEGQFWRARHNDNILTWSHKMWQKFYRRLKPTKHNCLKTMTKTTVGTCTAQLLSCKQRKCRKWSAVWRKGTPPFKKSGTGLTKD